MPRPTEASGLERSETLSSTPAALSTTLSPARPDGGRIKLLRVLHNCDEEKALRLAVAFLRDNLGTGSLSGSVDADEDAAIAEDDLRRTTEINEIWQAAQPIDGSPAESI